MRGKGLFTLTPALSLKGEGDQGKGLFLGPVEPLASCLHDVARVDDGHVEGGEIDVPILVMGGGDEDELVVP